MTSPQWQPAADPDRGQADPEVRDALAHGYEGEAAYLRAVATLCTARLILPTVEAPEDAEPGVSKADDHEHRHEHADRATVTLRSASGEKALLVFTGYDALRAWNPEARPVRCTLDDVAATVLETASDSILVDVAGPHSLVIEGPLVAELARGHRLVELPDSGFGWLWVDAPAG